MSDDLRDYQRDLLDLLADVCGALDKDSLLYDRVQAFMDRERREPSAPASDVRFTSAWERAGRPDPFDECLACAHDRHLPGCCPSCPCSRDSVGTPTGGSEPNPQEPTDANAPEEKS